jgi:hypothetical protein
MSAENVAILNELMSLRQEMNNILAVLREHNTKKVKEWVSIKEACELMNCSPYKLRLLIENGFIVSSKSGNKGALVAISRKSLNQFFENIIYVPSYATKKRV